MAPELTPERLESSSLLNRRKLLALLGVSAVATVASDTPRLDRTPSKVTAYLPTWLPTTSYEHIRANAEPSLDSIGRVHLAFARFNAADATVSMPALTPGLRDLIDGMAPGTDVSLSLGGGAAGEQTWYAAWANRLRYSKSVDDSRIALEDTFQRPVHVDIDCERSIPSDMLVGLAQTLRDSLTDQRDLSMAVPAHHQLDTFDTRPARLGDTVDTFRVMTYDQHGPWSETAGPIATGKWTLSAMSKWAQKVGDTTKLEVGYPTYGYKYPGANQAGDGFSIDSLGHPSVLYTDLPETAIHDDAVQMTSEAILDNEIWTSCLSPRMIGAITMKLYDHYPNLGGSFFWSMDGLTSAHVDAVTVHLQSKD